MKALRDVLDGRRMRYIHEIVRFVLGRRLTQNALTTYHFNLRKAPLRVKLLQTLRDKNRENDRISPT